MKSGNPVNCHKCTYYYVTWDKRFPHGCKGMGFKSRQLPSMVVRESSAQRECLMYREKTILRSVSNRGTYA